MQDSTFIFFSGMAIYFILSVLCRNFNYFQVGVSLLICYIADKLFTFHSTTSLLVILMLSVLVVSTVFAPLNKKLSLQQLENQKIKKAFALVGKIAIVHNINGNYVVFINNSYWKINNKTHLSEGDLVKVINNNLFDLCVEAI